MHFGMDTRWQTNSVYCKKVKSALEPSGPSGTMRVKCLAQEHNTLQHTHNLNGCSVMGYTAG